MHPVDEFARIRAEIRGLESRAKYLRQRFLNGDDPLESNAHVVHVKHQTRRLFNRDALPEQILDDPFFWEVKSSPVVTVRSRVGVDDKKRATNGEALIDDGDVFEPFGP